MFAPIPKKKPTCRVDIEVPSVPNYIRLKNNKNVIDVSELSDDDITSLGIFWTEKLKKHVYNRRNINFKID